MARQNIKETVEKMALPVVQEAGLELVEVSFVKEGGSWYLRIFIDKPGGIGVEDCRYVSEEIDRKLDEKDLIPNPYVLEVSSPGIERPLKKLADFNRFAGKLVAVTTFTPLGGKKKLTGRIVGVREDQVVLDTEGSELPVPFEQIASARLKADFNSSGRKK